MKKSELGRVALVTCIDIPEPDPDEAVLVGAFDEAGIEVDLLPWDDPAATPEKYDLCILRSCWNYPEHPEEFEAWLESVNGVSRLYNPLEVCRWNLRKTYLREYDALGISTIPTEFVERGHAIDVESLIEQRGWSRFVVKPTISAGSLMTERFDANEVDRAQKFLSDGAHERDWMIQEYLEAVEGPIGEHAIVFIDGQCSHAVRKSPRFHDDEERISDAFVPNDEQKVLASRILERVPEILYGRVDMIQDSDGKWLLAELELLEPSLFFLQHPPALNRFIEAVRSRLDRG